MKRRFYWFCAFAATVITAICLTSCARQADAIAPDPSTTAQAIGNDEPVYHKLANHISILNDMTGPDKAPTLASDSFLTTGCNPIISATGPTKPLLIWSEQPDRVAIQIKPFLAIRSAKLEAGVTHIPVPRIDLEKNGGIGGMTTITVTSLQYNGVRDEYKTFVSDGCTP